MFMKFLKKFKPHMKEFDGALKRLENNIKGKISDAEVIIEKEKDPFLEELKKL
jgi:hypothetical protein